MANSQELAQIEEINKGLTTLNGTLSATAENYLKLVKTINESNVAINTNVASTTSLNNAQKQTTQTAQQLDSLGKQLQASEQKLKDTEDGRLKTIIENRIATQAATKAISDKVKANEAEEGSLVRMRQRLSELTKAYDQAGTRTKEAEKEINNLSREIGVAEAATNRHQRGVGGYADQLGKLPGFLGQAASSTYAFGQEMLSLIKIPIIAVLTLIVAGLTALYSIFTSTASGGKLVKEVMASISAIFDVLKQRATVLINAFSALFSGDFTRSADLFKQSVSGIGDQMADAAKQAWGLVDAQSALNKELAFHVSEEAGEVNAIQKALFAAKDKTKSDQERLANLSEVMRLSKEQSEKEVEYSKRQYIIDTDKAALRAKISGVTADQLRAFIQMDAVEQMSALKGSEALKKMYDLIGGADKFKPLEESYAKVIDADTKFFEGNKRTQSQQSTLINEMAAENKKRTEDALKAKVDAVELGNKVEIQSIKQRHIDGITSDDQYKLELENQEVKFLNKKSALYKAGTREYKDAQIQIQDITIKSEDDILKKIEDSEKEKQKFYDDTLKTKIDADIAGVDSAIKEIEEIKKAEKDAEKEKLELKKEIREKEADIASEVINGIFDLGSAKRDQELAALDKEKASKLSNKNLTEAQKLKIEEEYDKKSAAIKTKQAKAEKLQAMFNIALSTAMGAANAASKVVTLPLVPFIIALGAVQLALAAAQPIPKFKYGTKDAPEMGIFGEAGRELMLLKSGEMAMANKATYFDGSKFKGAQILSNPETEKMIRMSDNAGGRQMTDDRILSGLMSVERAIKNKPVAIFDQEHRQIGHGTTHSQTIYLNRLIRNN